MKYIVEALLPEYQVHLIGGPSGAGKTRISFQLFKALSSGEDWFGRRTRPVKWAYISGDRPERSVRETMEELGVDFKVFSLVDRDLVGKDLLTVIIPQLTKFYGYKPDFIYIDGFTAMSPEGKLNSYLEVADWLASLQRYCVSKSVTILGACHTTKTKEGEKFLNPRQRIAGSVAWAGFSETVIIIDPKEEPGQDNQRLMSLLPRNKPSEFIHLAFNSSGVLEEIVSRSDLDGEIKEESKIVDEKITANLVLTPGLTLDYRACMEATIALGYSRRTYDRWLSRQVEDGILEHPRKGIYVVKLPNPDPNLRGDANPIPAPDHHKTREEKDSKTLERRENDAVPEEARKPEA